MVLMNNDDAVERWKETRAPRSSTDGYMTRLERERDGLLLSKGVPQCVRILARQTFMATFAVLRGTVAS